MEQENGEYSIAISTFPEGAIEGETSAIAVLGSYQFTGLVIKTPGSYNFIISVTDTSSTSQTTEATQTSQSFEISIDQANTPIGSMTFLLPTSEIHEFSYFSLEIYLFDLAGESLEEPCTISLLSDFGLKGLIEINSTIGPTVAHLYFEQSGNLSITITARDLSKVLYLQVAQVIHI